MSSQPRPSFLITDTSYSALVISRGPKLGARVTVPADKYRMECSVIPFQISVSLSFPSSLPALNPM